jgi:hypothetical protein
LEFAGSECGLRYDRAASTRTRRLVRPLLSDNPLFETFGQRALTQAVFRGSDFGECVTTIERVGDGTVDDWHREWVAIAGRVESIGDDAAAAGHAVSAREAFLRASTYYRTAYFPLFGAPVDPRLVDAFGRETAAFRKACPLFEPPIVPLEISFEGASLPGYFVPAGPGDRPRPTIVHVNGYDSNIQEVYFAHAPAATPRGTTACSPMGPVRAGTSSATGFACVPTGSRSWAPWSTTP